MQVASFYWQGITEPLLHDHEEKLQIARGQQVEPHLFWHCQQLVLLVFHDKKVSPYAERKKKKPFLAFMSW